MTLSEFLAKLRETPREWNTDNGGKLRRGCRCPIEDVLDLPSGMFWTAATRMGDIYNSIIASADKQWGHDAECRAQLLEACGLPPEGV